MKEKLDYYINRHTMAVMSYFRKGDGKPCAHIMERHDAFDVSCSGMKIMDKNCQMHGASYRGRENYTKLLTIYRSKVPVSLSDTLTMYAFPLVSITQPTCIWVMHDHMSYVSQAADGCGVIHFDNGETLKSPKSYDVTQMAFQKCSHLRHAVYRHAAEQQDVFNNPANDEQSPESSTDENDTDDD